MHSELGRTVVLMIWMYKPLFYTVNSLVMYSGFCVTEYIVALATKVVCSGALVKKRQY